MTRFAITYALAFILLIPAQAIIFNHMIIAGVAVPLLFLALIIRMPVTLGTNWSMILGFLAGLLLDIFCDTPGLNALCCTILAFVRKPIFHLYVSTDEDLASKAPSSKSMGMPVYLKYMLTMVTVYSLLLFTIQGFQLENFRLWIVRVIASTLYTFVGLWIFDSFTSRRRETS